MPEDGYSNKRGRLRSRSRDRERRERASGGRDGRRARVSRWDRSKSRERKEARDRGGRREEKHDVSRSRDERKESRDERGRPKEREQRQFEERDKQRRDQRDNWNRNGQAFRPDMRNFRRPFGEWGRGRPWDDRPATRGRGRGRGRGVFAKEIDRLKPEDVPRHGNYFLHDNRTDAEAMARQTRRRQAMSRSSPDRWGHDKFSILEEEEKIEKEKLAEAQEMQQEMEVAAVEGAEGNGVHQPSTEEEMTDMTQTHVDMDAVNCEQTASLQPTNE
ncbi:splicing regulatory glutamine/lysine-rich protein 1-like [Corticium candelabrum]|uniref:splicing regulatory glutamine/lysine-rich protein 1-like n=1 Tax=Corticium candelabrum TaxID=121492 RepID=UPI002E26A716|nr:splicing regulatory glutamine/lysine-rich protein 1-like [Corticium candelabrum]